MTLALMYPSAVYKESFLAAVREFQGESQHQYMGLDIAALEADFQTYVDTLLSYQHTPPQPGWVPETILWGVEGDVFIGRISIRHRLTDSLREFGGHIGYEVRPSQRHKGHGTAMLRLALPFARALGLTRAMLTCDEPNTGSRRIIEANGGVLQDVVKLDYRDVPTLRWWIDLAR